MSAERITVEFVKCNAEALAEAGRDLAAIHRWATGTYTIHADMVSGAVKAITDVLGGESELCQPMDAGAIAELRDRLFPPEPTPEEIEDADNGHGQANPVEQILAERVRQDEKWGEQNHNPFVWLSILIEEVGEVGKALIERDGKGYYEEVMQVGAVALSMMQSHLRNLDRDETVIRGRPDGGTTGEPEVLHVTNSEGDGFWCAPDGGGDDA